MPAMTLANANIRRLAALATLLVGLWIYAALRTPPDSLSTMLAAGLLSPCAIVGFGGGWAVSRKWPVSLALAAGIVLAALLIGQMLRWSAASQATALLDAGVDPFEAMSGLPLALSWLGWVVEGLGLSFAVGARHDAWAVESG